MIKVYFSWQNDDTDTKEIGSGLLLGQSPKTGEIMLVSEDDQIFYKKPNECFFTKKAVLLCQEK